MSDLHALAGGADRIVVVDTETTGVYASDRVVEIALVTISLDGELLDVWESLIQPERDVGATFIHGITASMVAEAPTFAEVAGDVAVRVQGACLAAHNLPFDTRMVVNEFTRLGSDLEVVAGLDTLQVTRAKLAEACSTHAVRLDGAHRALNDAIATAELLRCVAEWCSPGSPASIAKAPARTGRVLRREDTAAVVLPDPPLIAYLASRLSHPGVEANAFAYLEIVGRAVADLHLDVEERSQLRVFASELGLSEAQIAQAHRRYVNELIDAALEDHELTADEYEILVRISSALGVDQELVERRTKKLRGAAIEVELQQGLTLVFTGDHEDHPRVDLIAQAESMGLTVAKGLTKKTDLLVTADTNSNSGKAKKAQRYGVPVLSAADFAGSSIGALLVASGAEVESLKAVTCPDCLATWTIPAISGQTTQKRCEECKEIRSFAPPLPVPPTMPTHT